MARIEVTMFDAWPIFIVGVEVGLIIAIVILAFVQFCLMPLFEPDQSERRHND
jgi:hypothetical protein